MRIAIVFVILILLGNAQAFSQSAQSLLQDGNKAYSADDFTKAQNFYEQSIALDRSKKYPEAIFNLGNALFHQKKYDEAIKQFQLFNNQQTSDLRKEQSLYNIGNCYSAKQDYSSAMSAYKEALRLNPKDEDARYNLALAMNLSGEGLSQFSNSSSQNNKVNMPKSRPLTEEEKQQLLNHLADLENKTIQDLAQSSTSSTKKGVKDW
ncbi:MAG: tetratricopeptide repeat protein [Chitinophagales bacterium]